MADSKNNWISIYLFYDYDLSLLLVKLVIPLVNQWTKKKLITNYFFIRYWEEGQHIRLRIKTENKLSENSIKNEVIKIYKQEFLNTKYYDDTFNVLFQPYEPEINRYGGREATQFAELFFEYHSKIYLSILSKYWHKWNCSLALSIDIQMIIIFLKTSGCGIEDCILISDFLFSKSVVFSINESRMQDYEKEILKHLNLYNNLFSKQKSTINFICDEIWNHSNWEKSNWRFHWTENCKEIISSLQILKAQGLIKVPLPQNELNKLEEIHMIKNIEWLIWQSYFHMINNRMGVFCREESFVYFALLEGFRNLSKSNINHIK